MKIDVLDFDGDTNIGLYGIQIGNQLLLGNSITNKHDKKIKNTTGLDIKRFSIAGTDLLGVFGVNISNKLLLPHITFESEYKKFQAEGFNPILINTNNTCLGNNIIDAGDKVYVSNYMEEKAIKQIQKVTGKATEILNLGEYPNIGSTLVIGEKKAIASNSYELKEREIIKKALKQEVEFVSVSMGSPYLKSGILKSKSGLLISKISGGPELNAIEQGLNEENE